MNFRQVPGFAHYEKRYTILKNNNDDYQNIEINHSLQNFITQHGRSDSSIISNFILINSLYTDNMPGEKERLYGAWRSKLTGSTSRNEIYNSMVEGTRAMINQGYTDFAGDFLPFITGLMEEQHIVNYDNSRTKAFGRGSRGIVTSVRILNAIGSLDSDQNAGVCRDVHETGRELLKTMAETWYGHFHPDKTIDFDDFIFLQSWTTNKSHHVTISLIDPLENHLVYELDWGRVIEKWNNSGYDNGRLYGNTYRIWQYNEKKMITTPVDFRRTHFGKILDETILTRDEYLQFNGIYDEEFYSDARYLKDLGRYGGLSLTLGTYNPSGHYLIGGWHLETRKKKITRFLEHSNLLAVQGVIHEDTKKKILLYPQTSWQLATSIMGIPRIISKFETVPVPITRNISVNAYFNQQFDIFLIGNSFHVNDSTGSHDLSGSGDGNLSFSNGVNIIFKPGDNFHSSFTLQARSCLLPGDIRLFTPNVFTLIPNLRFITPSIDAIATGRVQLSDRSSLMFDGMFEFTNLDAVIWSGMASARFTLPYDLTFVTSVGSTKQLRGIEYFWYPASGRKIDLQLMMPGNTLSFSLLKYPESRISCFISYTGTIK